jgi:ABC-type metal ion transport system substrate-binding protein
MGTVIMILIVIFFTVIVCKMIERNKEKSVSVVVMSTDEAQAWELFFKQVGPALPKGCIKVKGNPTGTEFKFTLKK